MPITRKEPTLPYFSFVIAIYAQWLDHLQKLFPPAQSFSWVPSEEGVDSKDDSDYKAPTT